ncbi:MAG: hypothetical protein DRJ98_00925 [Thermoprotei archaeon]|nr:MAG: hypothetical protein DRJ98_00925 [Thermoprotei archaeon]
MSCRSCAQCPFSWVELEYFKCLKCGHVWLDDPFDPDAWKCPGCSAEGEQVTLLKQQVKA